MRRLLSFRSCRWLLLVASATCLGGSGCSYLVYQPSKNLLGTPEETPDDVWFDSADGVKLHGWWFEARGERRGTVVQFHGNAGNISSHYAQLEWVTRSGWDFFTFDYRGYGRSEGEPSQEGLLKDARAALATAKQRSRPTSDPDLVLYGQSLGGAVLLRMLNDERDRSRVRAVIVEGTFHSYPDAAAAVLWREPIAAPFAGFGYGLISDETSPSAFIERVSPLPFLVVHDVRDPIVPFRFGKAVYRLAHQPKEIWPVDYGGHLSANHHAEFRAALGEWMWAHKSKTAKR